MGDLRSHIEQRLESYGAGVDQSAAAAENERWLDVIRANGSTPADPTLRMLGGDITDTIAGIGGAGDIANLGADLFVGATVTNDTYNGAALPERNAIVVQASSGTFDRQIYAAGNAGNWFEAAGYPGQHYWPICAVKDPNNADRVVVGCWRADDGPSTGAPWGRLRASHLLSCSIAFGFLPIDNEVLAWPVNGPHILRFHDDGATYVYMLAEDFHPDYDPGFPGAATYAVGADIDDHHTRAVIARCARGSLTTGQWATEAWQWWNGRSWAGNDPSQAAYLTDTVGVPVRGDLDITRVPDGTWRLVGHHLVDTHVDAYRSDSPQGPWEKYARVPVPAMGATVNGGRQVGQFCRFVDHIVTGEETSVVGLALNLVGPTGAWNVRNIRRYSPQFVTVPWF